MKPETHHPYPAGRVTLRSLRPLRHLLQASVFAAAALTTAHAANITLSQAFLNSVNGFVNFAKPTLGSGSLAITNNLQPGDTIFIEGHTRELLILVNITQGTAANPITVTNTGGQFIIDYPDPPPANTGIRLWGLQHVRFKGTAGTGYTYGIKVNRAGSVGIKVEDNNYQQGRVGGTFGNTIDLEISDVEVCNTGFAGIQAKYEKTNADIPAGYTALLDGLRIHHTFIHDTIGGEGMYIGWTSDGHPDIANISIHHNLVQNTGWDGIQLNRSQGTNAVYNNDVIGYGINSIIYDNPPAQYYFWQSAGFSIGRVAALSIYNNWTQVGNQYSAGALSVFVGDTTTVYNNVFVLGDLAARDPQPGIYIGTAATVQPGATLKIMNNTIVEPDSNGIQFAGTFAVPTTIANNLIAHPIHGTYIVPPSSSTPTQTTNLSLATLAGAGFMNPATRDYHLAYGSAATDTGTDLTSSGVTTDHDGTARPLGAAFDIGAYERQALTVLTPAAWGQASGSGFCSAAGAFNEQPTWDAIAGAPTGVAASPHTSTSTAYANRFWYVDFGPNWAKLRITQMWTRYRPNSPGSFSGFAGLWWDDDIDTVNDGTTAGTMNFATAQNVANLSTQQWIRDRDFSSAPIVPQGRYLVVSTGATVTDRPNEFAFIGYTVP